jgi:hypothetical protein
MSYATDLLAASQVGAGYAKSFAAGAEIGTRLADTFSEAKTSKLFMDQLKVMRDSDNPTDAIRNATKNLMDKGAGIEDLNKFYEMPATKEIMQQAGQEYQAKLTPALVDLINDKTDPSPGLNKFVAENPWMGIDKITKTGPKSYGVSSGGEEHAFSNVDLANMIHGYTSDRTALNKGFIAEAYAQRNAQAELAKEERKYGRTTSLEGQKHENALERDAAKHKNALEVQELKNAAPGKSGKVSPLSLFNAGRALDADEAKAVAAFEKNATTDPGYADAVSAKQMGLATQGGYREATINPLTWSGPGLDEFRGRAEEEVRRERLGAIKQGFDRQREELLALRGQSANQPLATAPGGPAASAPQRPANKPAKSHSPGLNEALQEANEALGKGADPAKVKALFEQAFPGHTLNLEKF